jgi:hypothetical protein
MTTTCSRRWAALLCLIVCLAAAVAAWGARPPHLEANRTIGYGQVRFNGLGPEKWAQRYRQQQRTTQRLRELLTRKLDHLVGLIGAFQCIHSHEGSWTDSGAPYYGGLQMDWSFMRAYGGRLLQSRGTANHWTPAQQLAVAITAYATRGFGPWPNTSRMCGLR